MTVSSVSARRVASALVLFCAAAGLAGCDAAMQSIAQDSVERESRAESARIEAQGNPQFADPKLQAFVREFEAEYARYGRDGEKLLAEASASCDMAPKRAYALLAGGDPDLMEQAYAKQGIAMTEVVDYDSLKLMSISGHCGPEGIEGPGEIVGSYRKVTRLESAQINQVTVTDTVLRLRGSWRDGRRQGPFRTIQLFRSARFEPTAEGELKAQVADWAYLNEIQDAPTAVWTYASFGPGGETEPVVSFLRKPEVGLFNTDVMETRADGRGYHRVWSGSELRSEGPTKNGLRHGWQVTYPYTYKGTAIAGTRTCYQNGERLMATRCPES